MSDSNLKVEWVDGRREPKCSPDPRYPEGIDLDMTNGQNATCETSLPYPAKRCGYFVVTCSLCNLSIAITTAGRVDDPRFIKVPCKLENLKKEKFKN
jgi:hypothetical protein